VLIIQIHNSYQHKTPIGHRGAVNCLKYDADGALLITGGADGTLKQWDLKNGELLRTFEGILLLFL
jgi:WD40 repeat protein